MTDTLHTRLLGTYSMPPFSYGDMVQDLRHGEVEIVKLSDAPIPWPIGRRMPRGRQRFLVLYGALLEAVRRESVLAVAHHWGVTAQTVTAWRKALGVAEMNEGTRLL